MNKHTICNFKKKKIWHKRIKKIIIQWTQYYVGATQFWRHNRNGCSNNNTFLFSESKENITGKKLLLNLLLADF